MDEQKKTPETRALRRLILSIRLLGQREGRCDFRATQQSARANSPRAQQSSTRKQTTGMVTLLLLEILQVLYSGKHLFRLLYPARLLDNAYAIGELLT